MMSQGNVCRLCAEICQDYKSLYDESGNANEVQQLMIQYFDEKLLHMATENNSTVICMKCWHTISDFNSYQQSIYQTQRILRMEDEEIDIKSEEEFLPEDNIDSSNWEQPTNWKILAGEEATLPWCDSETIASSADDSSKTDDAVEYDDPVGVLVGGEFGNEGNSSELPVAAASPARSLVSLNAECNKTLKIKKIHITSNPQTLFLREQYRISVQASDNIIAQWTPFLLCIICKEKCSTFALLQRHFKVKHPLCKCKARCCKQHFSRRDRYEDHVRLHIDSNAFACTFCGWQLKCRRSLSSHIRKHHPVPIDATVNPVNDSNTASASSGNVTEISSKSIPKNMGDWRSCRTKYITGSDDFIAQIKPILNCYLCPELYTTFSLFRQHFAESHPDKQCYITCCQRKLTERYRILEHLQIHANPDEFKCKLCEARYTTRDQLKRHLRKCHTTSINENMRNENTSKRENKPDKRNEKSDELLAKWLPSRKCVLCKKAFDKLTVLQTHFLECHTNEDFYVECCQRKLKTRRAIVAHVRYHVEPTDFKCDLCCICYSRERTLRKHMCTAQKGRLKFLLDSKKP